jgi:hypothetical protein
MWYLLQRKIFRQVGNCWMGSAAGCVPNGLTRTVLADQRTPWTILSEVLVKEASETVCAPLCLDQWDKTVFYTLVGG